MFQGVCHVPLAPVLFWPPLPLSLGRPSTRRYAAAAADKRKPRIVLRSSWQTVNIGDIAHTPGVLALLEKHLPEAEVRLWPSKRGQRRRGDAERRFPQLAIVQGAEDQEKAFAECDFLLHGSGPSLVAAKDVARWRKETGKPYGIYGITLSTADPQVLESISGAKFVFFRDSVSLQFAKESGAKCPVMEFGPDGAFAVDLRNDEAAERSSRSTAWRRANSSAASAGCGTRRTGRSRPPDDRRGRPQACRERGAEGARPRSAARGDRRGGRGRHEGAGLPGGSEPDGGRQGDARGPAARGVKKSVVWRESYWLTDEALSTYVRSAGLFGNEMHCPIMCIGNGIPAIVCRWKEQTSKGFMWRDIGLGDWLFDLDDPALDLARISAAVLSLATDPAAARAKVASAQQIVRRRQAETMGILAKQFA